MTFFLTYFLSFSLFLRCYFSKHIEAVKALTAVIDDIEKGVGRQINDT